MERKAIIYAGCSVDGYIARKDGNLDFLDSPTLLPGEDYGYTAFVQGIDTVIWGRRTYDKVLSFGVPFPHPDKKVFVVSRTLVGEAANVTFHQDVVALVKELKTQPGKDIYCDGGGEVITTLLKANLIDRLVISIVPWLAGDGIRLFQEGLPDQKLALLKSLTFPNGMVQLWYDLVANHANPG